MEETLKHRAGFESLDRHQLEVAAVAVIREETPAAAEEDGIDDQAHFVDQIAREQRLRCGCAREDRELTGRLPLNRGTSSTAIA